MLRTCVLSLVFVAQAFGAAEIKTGMTCRYRNPNREPALLVEVKNTAASFAYVEPKGGSRRLPLAHWTRKANLTPATAVSFKAMLTKDGDRRYLVEVTHQVPGAYFVKFVGSNPRQFPDQWVSTGSVTKADPDPSN